MKNEIKVIGKQEFMGREIQVLEGGFGDNQWIITVKQIAEIHEVEMKRINELINDNLDEFEESIDIIDAKNSDVDTDSLLNIGYTKQSIANAKHIYILSEQGYIALVSLMKTDKAKQIRKQFRREYFKIVDTARTITKSIESIELNNVPNDIVISKNGTVITTSRKIAEVFNKEHREILRAIDNKLKSNNESIVQFCTMNIKENYYLAENGQEYREYELTEEGFNFIALSLTGENADVYKIKYIEAFSKMKKSLIDMFKARLIENVLPQDNRLRQFVYIIENVDNGAIKIGVGNDPAKRLKQLQTGSVSELSLVYQSNVCSNAFDIEAECHHHFEKYHIRGEWYDVSKNEVINYLEQQNFVLKSEFSKYLYGNNAQLINEQEECKSYKNEYNEY